MRITDDDGHVETQVVTVTVDQVNDAGTFTGNLSGTGAEDAGDITGATTFADAADGFTTPNFTVSVAASNGTAVVTSAGAWTYSPATDFNGSDSFTLSVTDDDGNVETQVVSITVTPTNDAGTFGGDITISGAEDAVQITGTVTFADAIDGFTAPFTFELDTDATNGAATVDQNGN